MFKPLQFIAFFYGLGLQLIWASSEIDPEEFIHHSCLVHASNFPPVNNIKYAGATINNQIIPFDKAARSRVTLHHCLGSLVPNEAMGSVVYLWGMPISASMHEGQGHSISPYVFLTPVRKIVDRIYGGSLSDLFVIDQIEYDEDTTVFINNSHLNNFKEKSPDFKGKIILFNSDHDDVRALVNQEIEKQGFWLTAFNRFSQGTFQEMTINGEHFTSKSIEELFKKVGWSYVNNHNNHLFNFLEQYIFPINTPFLQAFRSPHGEVKTSSILSVEKMEVYKHALDFLFQQLTQEVSNKSAYLQRSLATWQFLVGEWQRVHERMAHIFKNYDFKFNCSQLQPWIDNRNSSEELSKLEEGLTTAALKRVRPYYTGESSIGYEWHYFLAYQYEMLDTLCQYVQAQVPAWKQAPGILSWFAITHLFSPHHSVDEAMEKILAGYIHKTAEEVQALDGDIFERARHEFWRYIKQDKSEYATHSLSKIERLRLLPALAYILGENSLKEVTVLDFPTLLRIAPMTRILYGDDDDLIFACGSFMKSKFKDGPEPTVLEESLVRAAVYSNAVRQLLLPINPQPNTEIYKFIKDGTLGTLDEIFTKLGLHTEFRERFPADEDFWNVKMEEHEFIGPSFYSIYLELEMLKRFH
ncbi:hypothetical protein [Candidatus Paracaedibacter symbiosus]|uniref:hypothetical protein n=1 Tax=Candidatus Paracaedibacter symbiosus TaxID=244582 RepID=UPI0005099E91|nr:hypothetical protein [Candidatus Paracaedibacter symbiosus]